MFTPSELEGMPKAMEKYASELETHIMEDIVRRIKINDSITRSADWQIYRLRQMGKSTEYIQQQIKKFLDVSNEEIERLYNEVIETGYARDEEIYTKVGKEFIPFQENDELQQAILGAINQSKEEMVNFTQSMGFTLEMPDGKTVFTPLATYYQEKLDSAFMGILNGSFDYQSILSKTVKEMTKSGLRTVDYASGHYNRIEVATRRAVMTGITQVTGKINEQNAEKLGTDKFEISWHATARPSHQDWQGRVFTYNELITKCGLGTVTGLCGANCYHSYYPFIDGVSVRMYTDEQLEKMNAEENKPRKYNGKEYTSYTATQRMRQLETKMRAQRKEITLLKAGGAEDELLTEKRCKYRATSEEYKKFSAAMNLPEERQRVTIDGAGRV